MNLATIIIRIAYLSLISGAEFKKKVQDVATIYLELKI